MSYIYAQLKNTGITRNVDELGRLVLPIELRNRLKIKEKDKLEIYLLEQDLIVLRKMKNECVFCGQFNNLIEFKGKHICTNCKMNIRIK